MVRKKFVELLKVKSIITILVFRVFCYLSVIGKVDAHQFMLMLSNVATYYFAKKDKKEGA